MAFVMNPQKGWVKAGGTDNTELLSRLADLQKRYDDLVEENTELKKSSVLFNTESLAQGNDSIKIEFDFVEELKEIESTYNEIFFGIGHKLFAQCEIYDVKHYLENVIFEKYQNTKEFIDYPDSSTVGRNDLLYEIKISEQSLAELEIQLQALELIAVSGFAKQYSQVTFEDRMHNDNKPSIHTEIAKTWSLTDKGKKYYLSQRAIRHEKVGNSQN